MRVLERVQVRVLERVQGLARLLVPVLHSGLNYCPKHSPDHTHFHKDLIAHLRGVDEFRYHPSHHAHLYNQNILSTVPL